LSGLAEKAKLTASVNKEKIRNNLFMYKNHIPKRIIGNRKI